MCFEEEYGFWFLHLDFKYIVYDTMLSSYLLSGTCMTYAFYVQFAKLWLKKIELLHFLEDWASISAVKRILESDVGCFALYSWKSEGLELVTVTAKYSVKDPNESPTFDVHLFTTLR